jgi:hypothetical protein
LVWISVDTPSTFVQLHADIHIGWDDFSLQVVERMMQGYWLIQGMDLSYEILAHIVDGTGSVIGFVAEADLGRLPQYRDRALLYEAFSRLQQRGIVYCSQVIPYVTIMHGKVRLTNLPGLCTEAENPTNFAKWTEWFHWEQLEHFFFSYLDPNDFIPRPSWTRRIDTPLVQITPYPGLHRPLLVKFDYLTDIQRTLFRVQEVETERETDKKDKRKLLLGSGPHGKATTQKSSSATLRDDPYSSTRSRGHKSSRLPDKSARSKATSKRKVLLPEDAEESEPPLPKYVYSIYLALVLTHKWSIVTMWMRFTLRRCSPNTKTKRPNVVTSQQRNPAHQVL